MPMSFWWFRLSSHNTILSPQVSKLCRGMFAGSVIGKYSCWCGVRSGVFHAKKHSRKQIRYALNERDLICVYSPWASLAFIIIHYQNKMLFKVTLSVETGTKTKPLTSKSAIASVRNCRRHFYQHMFLSIMSESYSAIWIVLIANNLK